MGYYIQQVVGNSGFCLPKKHIGKALANLKAMTRKNPNNGHFIDWDSLYEAKTLEQALGACRFRFSIDKYGNAVSLNFFGQKLGGMEDDIMAALAQAGAVGTIAFRGEGKYKWEYTLKDGACTST